MECFGSIGYRVCHMVCGSCRAISQQAAWVRALIGIDGWTTMVFWAFVSSRHTAIVLGRLHLTFPCPDLPITMKMAYYYPPRFYLTHLPLIKVDLRELIYAFKGDGRIWPSDDQMPISLTREI